MDTDLTLNLEVVSEDHIEINKIPTTLISRTETVFFSS